MWCDKHNVDHSMNRSISFAQCINAARFEQINAKQKLKNNNQLNYCKNCLINHVNIECFSTKRCCKCQLATLLHGALVTQIPKIKTILGINCNIVLHNTSDKIPAPVQLEEERRKLEENNQKQKDPINQEPIPTTRRAKTKKKTITSLFHT